MEGQVSAPRGSGVRRPKATAMQGAAAGGLRAFSSPPGGQSRGQPWAQNQLQQ